MQDPIFEPIVINGLTVKNRIYMPAMHLGMAANFEVTDPLVDFYAERARGGAGLICVGYATVDELSGNTTNIGAHLDDHIPGLRRLATAIKENGACAAVQLNHAGRYNFSFFLDGRQPVAPSAVASRMTRETPQALALEEIQETIEAFARAAARVQAAGYDAVEILSGTGYLISEFLSPLTNHREDRYGGGLENRMRFGLEVMQAIRRTVGEGFPLIVRMNGNDFMADGQDRRELQVYARALQEQAGVDALSINVGWHEARVPQITTAVPRGAFAYLARAIKDQVSIPVVYGHRVNDPATARDLILNEMCDMVAMGRSLIADPDLPEKARRRREQDIVHCVACAQGCFDNLFKLKSVECLCNPRAGHEGACPTGDKAAAPKTVMVIGGGPAGMRAALTAAERGHKVCLYEAAERLGGQLFLAAAPPGRREFAVLAEDLARQVMSSAIELHLNTAADLALVRATAPDHVILATGAEPLTLPIPGIDAPHVVQAWDVQIAFFDMETEARLPIAHEGQPIADDAARLTTLRVPDANPLCDKIAPLTTPVTFADAILLTHTEVTQAAETWRVGLCWESTAPVAEDYTVFVHAYAADGTLLGTGDSPPMRQAFPTSAWQPGDRILDPHTLTWDEDGAPALIAVGLYHPETGARLPAAQAGTRLPNDAAIIWEAP